jgi:hypothetical protein
VRGACKVVMRRVRQGSRRSTAEYTTIGERSLGTGGCRNSKKGIRLCQEDFMCDLKLQWGCDKSVARIRLMKTENLSACAAVSWKVQNSDSAVLPIVPKCVKI